MSLDDLVRRADPMRDEPLEFDDAFEALREEIVARPVVARTRPPRRRRWLVPPAVAVVASAVALIVFFAPGDGGTERAWAAPLVKVAESVPRLLVGDWQVTRADQFAVREGEMTFEDGSRKVDLAWRGGTLEGWTKDRERARAGARRLRARERARLPVLRGRPHRALGAGRLRHGAARQCRPRGARRTPRRVGRPVARRGAGERRAPGRERAGGGPARAWWPRSRAAGSRPGSTARRRNVPRRSPPSRRPAVGPS